MNTHPSRVTLSLEQPPNPISEAVLMGGQAFCFFVMPDSYSVRVSSKQACFPQPDEPENCFSDPYPVTVSAKEVSRLNIWPKATREGYNCGWDILPRGVSQPGNCLQPSPPPECFRHDESR